MRKRGGFTDTKLFVTDKNTPSLSVLSECASILKSGGIVAFPTETVYGLGGNAFSERTVEAIYAAKNRPPIKALSVCVYDLEQAEQIAVFDDKARAVFNAFLPGPLTLVLKKKSCVPDIVSAGLDTVGIRVPSNTVARELLRLCGVPLALPSANLSGCPSLTDGKAVAEALMGRVDAIIDAGVTDMGKESTIISLADSPVILRRGAIPDEALAEFFK